LSLLGETKKIPLFILTGKGEKKKTGRDGRTKEGRGVLSFGRA